MVVDCSVTNVVALDRLNKQTLTLAPPPSPSPPAFYYDHKLILVKLVIPVGMWRVPSKWTPCIVDLLSRK